MSAACVSRAAACVSRGVSYNLMENFEAESCIRGFHIYKDNWLPVIGEQIKCIREDDNPRDRYAVAVVKTTAVGDETVGHIPRCISAVCSSFL